MSSKIEIPTTVQCVKGHPGLLDEGAIYTVVDQTYNGNYILSEVPIPDGYTSFNKDRFSIVDTIVFEFEDQHSNVFEGE